MCQFINFVIVTNALLQNNETAEIGFIGRNKPKLYYSSKSKD